MHYWSVCVYLCFPLCLCLLTREEMEQHFSKSKPTWPCWIRTLKWLRCTTWSRLVTHPTLPHPTKPCAHTCFKKKLYSVCHSVSYKMSLSYTSSAHEQNIVFLSALYIINIFNIQLKYTLLCVRSQNRYIHQLILACLHQTPVIDQIVYYEFTRVSISHLYQLYYLQKPEL